MFFNLFFIIFSHFSLSLFLTTHNPSPFSFLSPNPLAPLSLSLTTIKPGLQRLFTQNLHQKIKLQEHPKPKIQEKKNPKLTNQPRKLTPTNLPLALSLSALSLCFSENKKKKKQGRRKKGKKEMMKGREKKRWV
jgi:hypothetical protein